MTLNALTKFDECISDWTIAALSVFSNHLADSWTPQRFRCAAPIFFTGYFASRAADHTLLFPSTTRIS
jgi:hypothetical protein